MGVIPVVALWTVIVGAIIRHSGPAGSPAFIALLTAEAVLSIATGIWQFRKIRKHPYHWTQKDRDRTSAAGAWAGSLGSLIRAGNVFAGLVVGILAIVSYGAILAVLAISLAPELPRELEARRQLAQELEWRGSWAHGPGKRRRRHRR